LLGHAKDARSSRPAVRRPGRPRPIKGRQKRPPVRITFEITCDLELKGLVVKVQDASIRALRIGACRAKGSVKCEGMLLIRRQTKDLDLPGRIALSPGIPIKRPSAAAVGKNTDRWHPDDPHDDRELMSAMPI